LAGYAAELALKAVIAGQFVAGAIPDKRLVNAVYTHNLETLVDHAGIRPELKRKQTDLGFAANWEVVSNWNEDARYQAWPESEAAGMVNALADPPNGVLAWIRLSW
jgi:hypothetical protein